MKAILRMGDKVWESQGKTAIEAFQKLPITVMDIKLKGALALIDRNRKTERVIMAKGLKRFAANKFMRLQIAKNFEKLLSERDVPQLYKVLKDL